MSIPAIPIPQCAALRSAWLLEGAEACVGTASGMAAILSVGMALLKSGDHVVCSRDVFGTTTNLFLKYLGKFGLEVTFVT